MSCTPGPPITGVPLPRGLSWESFVLTTDSFSRLKEALPQVSEALIVAGVDAELNRSRPAEMQGRR